MHSKNEELKESIDLWACSYVNWFKDFEKIAMKSLFVPLPGEIVEYLLDEVIILPKECYPETEAISSSGHRGASCSFNDSDEDDAGEVRNRNRPAQAPLANRFRCLFSSPSFRSSVA